MPLLPAGQTGASGHQAREAFLATAAKECRIDKSDIAEVLPATAAQESLFALSINNPSTYVARYVYSIDSHIDLDAFCTAYDATAQAHPALRTRFIQSESGDVLQAVLRRGTGCTRSLCKTISLFLQQDCCQPIAWGDDIVRAALVVSKDESKPYFVFTLHHVAYDDWALAVFLQHLQSVYLGHDLASRPFADFVNLCSKTVRSPSSARFWREELARDTAAVWPSPIPGYIPAATKSRIARVPLQHAMSLDDGSTTALLAWASLMSAFTGSEEVAYGLTSLGRKANLPGIDVVGGPTIATFPLLVSLQKSQSVLQAWQSLSGRLATIVDHEQFGLRNISSLSTEAAHLCGFQNLVVLQPRRKDDYSFLTEITSDMQLDNHATFGTYALTFVIEMADHEISVEAVYDHHVISETQIEHLQAQLSHSIKLINSVIARQDNSVLTVSLGDACPEDLPKIQGFNPPVPVFSEHQLLAHSLISDRAKCHPDAPAVDAWDGSFSYGKLEALSSNLAAYLVTRHPEVTVDTIIPLCFEKSKWTSVAMLGVMKAGAAFALMEPSTPLERLQTIYRDTGSAIVLCNDTTKATASRISTNILSIDAADVLLPQNHNKPVAHSPQALLYAVFTSGSTGTPKGVMIEHASFCHSVQAYVAKSGLNSKSRTLQYASYAFDVAVTDHLATLIGGGCICIPSLQDCSDDLAGQVRRYQVNYADLTPSVLRMLRPQDMPSLETILIGGEAMSYEDISTWINSARLINIYGPAECCVLSTMQHDIRPETDPKNIGFSTGGSCWVVDKDHDDFLAPIGGVGELLIGGPIVGRGYLNNPEKTAASFIAAPAWHENLTSQAGGCLYKTGDLVRRLPDGSLLFLGRKDLQVKIRGQRIDLGEVEHCTKAEIVAQDIVVDVVRFQRNTSALLLVAFVCRPETSESAHGNLFARPSDSLQSDFMAAKDRLRSRVPKYMVPDLFLPVSRVPLMATGKTDRKLLRAAAAALSEEDYILYTSTPSAKKKDPPRTPQEELLRDIVARQTGLQPSNIGIRDNLFTLGLDSISTMKVVGLLRQQELLIKAADIYTSPTIFALSKLLRHTNGQSVTVDNGTSDECASREEKMERVFQHFSADLMLNGRTSTPSTETHVILTGSSGSLGPYVLDSLIQNSNVNTIYAFVRREHAAERQRDLHVEKGLPVDFSKVRFLHTDNTKPYFGLTVPMYGVLLNKITHVLHLAWAVNFMLPLDSFVDSHVSGVRHLIDFCTQSKHSAQLSLTSSSGITFGAVNQALGDGEIAEQLLPGWDASPTSGYAESKHISETLVAQACEQTGLRGAILRLGQIAGPLHRGTGGRWNSNEWLPAIIASSRTMKYLPVDLGPLDDVDWIPVDSMAAATVEIALTDRTLPGEGVNLYHLVNPSRTAWQSLSSSVATRLGASLVPFAKWVELLGDCATTQSETLGAAGRLLDYYRGMSLHVEKVGKYRPLSTAISQTQSETLRNLSPVTSQWMARWMDQWQM